MVAVGEAAARSSRVRLKIAPGWDVAPVRAVRSAFPALALQVDANCSYAWGADGPEDVARLLALDEYRLTCVEQPLAPADLCIGHARLARSCWRRRSAWTSPWSPSAGWPPDALRYGACEVACPQARPTWRVARRPPGPGGLPQGRRPRASWAGFFETGLARSPTARWRRLWRGSPFLPGDLSDPAGYLVDSPVAYLAVRTGRAWLTDEPGVAAGPWHLPGGWGRPGVDSAVHAVVPGRAPPEGRPPATAARPAGAGGAGRAAPGRR